MTENTSKLTNDQIEQNTLIPIHSLITKNANLNNISEEFKQNMNGISTNLRSELVSKPTYTFYIFTYHSLINRSMSS